MSMWFSNLGKYLLGKNGSSRVLNPPLHSAMGGRGAFNLLGHTWSRHQFVSVVSSCPQALPLPFSLSAPRRAREPPLRERMSSWRGRKHRWAKPQLCCCSQPSAQTRCQADSAQQEQADISSSCGWHGWAGASSWPACRVSLLLEAHPKLCWAVPAPTRRGTCLRLHAEQELSLQELLSALPHSSMEPQLFQLASHQGSSWNNSALPPASLPPFPGRVQLLCLPAAPHPRTGEGFPRLLVCHRRTCEPFLWLAAELGLTQCPVQVFLTLLLASAWLQILLMSVSVQWLYKWMGTSACLCLKSTFSSPHDHGVKLKHVI